MSSPMLKRELTPFKRRLQWRSSLRIFWLSLSLGLLFTGLLLGLGRIWPLLFRWQLLLIGLLATWGLVFLGQLYAWLKPLHPAQLARLGDAYLHLEERLTTAFELSEGVLETSPMLRQAQLDDTLTHLRQVSLAKAVPLVKRKQVFGSLGSLLIVAVVLAALYFWPNPLEAVVQQQVALENLLETEIEALEEIQTELLAEADDLGETQVEELRETLQALIDRLETARSEGSPERALAALSEAEQTLSALNEARLEQEQAFNSLADSLANTDFEATQEAGQALENEAFDQAAEALREAGQNPPATQAEADDLADALDQAASELEATNPDLAQSLQQSAEALQSGDAQAIQEALEQSAQQLAEAGEQQAGQEQLSQALENIQQAREALAQGGEGQGQAQAQGQGEGEGQGRGQNQLRGQAQEQGGGSGREDPGAGAEGLTSERGTDGSTISTDNGPNQNRLEDYSSVYAPDHLGGEGGPFVVPDRQGDDGSGVDIGETPLNPNRETGDVTVPYTEVYRQYRDQAATALDNSRVPLSMRDYIRQYFGALEPE